MIFALISFVTIGLIIVIGYNDKLASKKMTEASRTFKVGNYKLARKILSQIITKDSANEEVFAILQKSS